MGRYWPCWGLWRGKKIQEGLKDSEEVTIGEMWPGPEFNRPMVYRTGAATSTVCWYWLCSALCFLPQSFYGVVNGFSKHCARGWPPSRSHFVRQKYAEKDPASGGVESNSPSVVPEPSLFQCTHLPLHKFHRLVGMHEQVGVVDPVHQWPFLKRKTGPTQQISHRHPKLGTSNLQNYMCCITTILSPYREMGSGCAAHGPLPLEYPDYQCGL